MSDEYVSDEQLIHTLEQSGQWHSKEAAKRLRALRRNAFITNSKGHRVRYTNATAEERARAEGEV